MGFLMENGKIEWGHDGNKWGRKKVLMGLQMTEAFKKGLNFHKARVSFGCWGCDTNKPKRTRYLSNSYNKICIDCAMEWLKESEKTMQRIATMLYERKIELSENKDKWRKEQILGAIEGGNE